MGAVFEFRQVAIRPGKPFAVGWWGGLPICVLPGNPAAAFVCFQEFVRPNGSTDGRTRQSRIAHAAGNSGGTCKVETRFLQCSVWKPKNHALGISGRASGESVFGTCP
jgi:molybdopterin biosynthesis enzyme